MIMSFLFRCLALSLLAIVPVVALAQPAAPTHLVAFPGGNSIALRWDGSSGATSYRIFRGGVQVGTVTPGFHPLFPEKDGNGFVDTAASPGHDYVYQVQAASGASLSPMSASLPVTFPASTTPLPSVTFDSSLAPEFSAWMQGTLKPFVLAWYPKISDRIAWPDYAPPQTFTVRIDPSYQGAAVTSGDTITVSADWLRVNQSIALGVLMHEFTHVIQQHAQGGWITEGMASWTNVWLMREHEPIELPRYRTYFTGYSEAAYLFQWIEQRHPGFVRGLNLVKHAGTTADDDPDSVFRDLAGATPNQLWADMTGTLAGMELRFSGYKDRCVVGPPGISGQARIRSCNRTVTGQQWRFRRHGSNLVLAIGNNCLDVTSSGTANGTPLQLWLDCNGSGAQDWRLQANGTLLNPQSGRCLYAPSTTVGTQLQLHDCAAIAQQMLAPRPGEPFRLRSLPDACIGAPDADVADVQVRACDITAADQMWQVQGNGDGTLSLAVGSDECLDVRGGGIDNGAPLQAWSCNGSGAQKWRLQANGTLLNPQSGRCLDAGTGAVGTHLRLWTCSGGAGQAVELPARIFVDGFD